MADNVYDILEERGFIAQCTHPEELRELLGKEKVKFYIGFDATADSLTAGHFLTIMAMMHMQKAGHVPVALMGGGTTMVGDPSGKTEMRKILPAEQTTCCRTGGGTAYFLHRLCDILDADRSVHRRPVAQRQRVADGQLVAHGSGISSTSSSPAFR